MSWPSFFFGALAALLFYIGAIVVLAVAEATANSWFNKKFMEHSEYLRIETRDLGNRFWELKREFDKKEKP